MQDLQVVPVTMSSREIAKLTGKRHDNVMADVRNMLDELYPDGHAPDFSGTYRTERGNEYECFNLPRREVEILLTGYSVPLRAKCLDRLRELETGTALPAPKPVDMAAALGLVQLTFDHLPNLSEISKQAVLSGMLELVTGKALLPLPKLEEKHYTATEAGVVLGISAAKVGSLANAEGLKIPRFGYYRVQKRKGSDGQCEQWMYNEAGVEALRALLQ